MKYKLLSYILLASVLAIPAVGRGQNKDSKAKPELKWKPFDNGFLDAQKGRKKLMLDVYTDWCGWCKKLDRDVYGDEQVSRYLNEKYVVVKLNAEDTSIVSYKDKKYSKIALARSFGVSGYPTIIFFDSNGDAINSLGGYVAADKFLQIVKYIGGDYYKSMTWEKYQETADSRSPKEHRDNR